MAKLTGSITDADTGEPIAARVRVVASGGQFVHPDDAILKVGTGDQFFYSDGTLTSTYPVARYRSSWSAGPSTYRRR